MSAGKLFLVHRVDVPKHPGTPVYADSFPVFQYEVKLLWGQLLETALFYGRSKTSGTAVPVIMKDNFDSCPTGEKCPFSAKTAIFST